jgi:hypothetical protein
METEIDSLLNTSQTPQTKEETGKHISPRIDIEDMYKKVRLHMDEGEGQDNRAELSREAFWREMDQSEDNFQTLARFFAQNVIQ